MTHAGIICDGLVKIYQTSDIEVVALQGLDLDVEPGELVTLVGASGSGKSTLLNVLGGLDQPTAGRASVAGHDLLTMRPADRTAFRRNAIGFIWQQTARNLLPYLDARSNIEYPMTLTGAGRRERRERAGELLEIVGLADRGDHRPGQLSGGEQQRVAIAVALANQPSVLLADEPTGELDSETAEEIVAVLRQVNVELGVTGVIVTHDPLVSSHVDRTIAIRDGRISTETLRARHDVHGVISQEYAVLDTAGRLQLPEHYVTALDLRRRVRLELEHDHVGVWPESSTHDSRPPAEPAERPAAADVEPSRPAAPRPERSPAPAPASDPDAGWRPEDET